MFIKPKPARLDFWGIKAELGRKGFTLAKLAAESGLDKQRISACLKRPDPRANLCVAKVLNIPVHELWPHWFDADGDLLPPKYRKKLSTQRTPMASHESAVAS